MASGDSSVAAGDRVVAGELLPAGGDQPLQGPRRGPGVGPGRRERAGDALERALQECFEQVLRSPKCA
jgi:hypothetical protein